ncbi:hypothetical protein [uncultured Tenacibaculum sp.]|uniref:hypothetical protein n=1 Tax=uncultured Tenacibaculum sp. TaxID=174713 RepID=UPI002639D47A|nr:hypothetical protein [uncultured Tenacibaculum sp.]
MIANSSFHFNPFSGVLHEDIPKVILPNIDIDQTIHRIQNSDSLALEFIGRQGRGKTSHLRYLQHILPEYPIFLLNSTSSVSDVMKNTSEIVFVDSIHHLSFSNRVQLFKEKKVVIYTTHWRRKIDCLLAKKEYHSIRFKGIEPEKLQAILNERLKLASGSNTPETLFSITDVNKLIRKFGDNYRGIINHLYEKYQ